MSIGVDVPLRWSATRPDPDDIMGTMALLPDVLPVGPLHLRRWSPAVAAAMLVAIEESFPELEQWMPWAQEVPTLEALSEVIRQGEIDFHADRSWEYALVDAHTDEVLGAAGLHRTEDPEKFEIGYWVRTSRTRRGVATSVARALVSAASDYLETARQIVIRMDQANLASASVPRKLGFTLDAPEDRDVTAKGHTGRGYVWILDLPDRGTPVASTRSPASDPPTFS